MYGTREFRFSYLDANGYTQYIFARNVWLAEKAVFAKGGTEVKRAPFPKKERLTTGHCQICGREIGTTMGLIAHHGYKRPWPQSGCQTASCFGARYQEYAVAHDALDALIPMIKADISRFQEQRTDFLLEPPATLKYEYKDRWGHMKESIDVARPEGFDFETCKPDYIPRSYVSLYLAHVHWLDYCIRSAMHDLTALTKRRKEWRAPK